MDDQSKTTEQQEPNEGQPQRDANGRFGKGNHGGPGNPFARQTAKLRQAALEAVSADEVHDIIEALKLKAKAGDVAASKLLLSYTLGKPTAAADPDTLDRHEMQTFVNNHSSSIEEFIQVVEGMPIDALVVMLRTLVPVLRTCKMKFAKEVMTAPPANEAGDDDVLHVESKPQSTAGATENAAAPEQNARNDNIPPWMHEIVSREQHEGAAPKQPMAAPQQKAMDEIQKLLRKLMSEVQKQRAGGHAEETSQPQALNGELLKHLLGRMQGIGKPQGNETPPSVNGKNGAHAGTL